MGTYDLIYQKFQKEKGDTYPIRVSGSRETLAELFSDLGFKIGAEIGTRRGLFAKVLLRSNSGLKLYCIDPYSPYVECDDQRKQDKIFIEAKRRLRKYDVEHVRKCSMDALSDINDESLNFVYIDGLHDEMNVYNDISCWLKKVRSNGIISGHDYFSSEEHPCVQVVLAVDRFFKGTDWLLHVTTDQYPSWFAVKQ
ncbi:MAG: class I SAM-dependent methyltransferase [bacterium]